ncbi:hypothetical protein [Dyadobacter jiangsuensis]
MMVFAAGSAVSRTTSSRLPSNTSLTATESPKITTWRKIVPIGLQILDIALEYHRA